MSCIAALSKGKMHWTSFGYEIRKVLSLSMAIRKVDKDVFLDG
jgi:hypothetical protein